MACLFPGRRPGALLRLQARCGGAEPWRVCWRFFFARDSEAPRRSSSARAKPKSSDPRFVKGHSTGSHSWLRSVFGEFSTPGYQQLPSFLSTPIGTAFPRPIGVDALPPLGEGEYYHSDLIGLHCVDQEGANVGTVISVDNFGAGDLLEVKTMEGRRSLIPFKSGIADLQDGRIVLDLELLA